MANTSIYVEREELNSLLGEAVGERKIDILWDNIAQMWIFFLDEIDTDTV